MPDTGTFAGYGADGMYRLASMYYHGIPPAGSCTYKPYRLDGSLVYEQLSFYLAGRRVIVSAYEQGFRVSFSEFDAGHCMVHYDHVSFHASGRPSPAPAPDLGAPMGDAPGASPFACYVALLDEFVAAAVNLYGFNDPYPGDPAFLTACHGYSSVLYRLLAHAFPDGVRPVHHAVPQYDGEASDGASPGRCSCGRVVRRDWDYCPGCGALLRWDCCCPA